MYTTLNNIIVMTRGDSLEFKPNIKTIDEYADYELQGDESIYFGIMDPRQPFEEALIRKKYTSDDIQYVKDLIIELEPEDTLDLIPGRYYHALKLHIDHTEQDALQHSMTEVDKVITLINKTKFILND